jgi:hypothetical protein
MVAVADLLAAGAVCMDCLVTQADLRVDGVTRQLEALGADLREARCTVCAEPGPVFSIPA